MIKTVELSNVQRRIAGALVDAYRREQEESAKKLAPLHEAINLYAGEMARELNLPLDEFIFDIAQLKFVERPAAKNGKSAPAAETVAPRAVPTEIEVLPLKN